MWRRPLRLQGGVAVAHALSGGHRPLRPRRRLHHAVQRPLRLLRCVHAAKFAQYRPLGRRVGPGTRVVGAHPDPGRWHLEWDRQAPRLHPKHGIRRHLDFSNPGERAQGLPRVLGDAVRAAGRDTVRRRADRPPPPQVERAEQPLWRRGRPQESCALRREAAAPGPALASASFGLVAHRGGRPRWASATSGGCG